ncbi:MAG: YfhO family protein [Kiritimatiellales bacterium]|nr:YfhO family protein [Kiritimatiellota bacterium]MBL7011629.1 YfhO family protein [Kiritimatiellales bacterium]
MMNPILPLLKKMTPVWLVIILAVTATMISLPVLSERDSVFSFNDGSIETQLAEGSHPPDTFQHHWNNQFFLGLGMKTSSFNTVNLLEWTLGAHQYRRVGVLLAIIFAGWAAYAACRLSARSKPASFIAGIIAGLCGWTVTFPMAGLTARAWLLSWMLLSIGLIHYGKRTGKWLPYMLAGGFLGMAITDSPDVGILAALCCALYFVLYHFSSKAAFRRNAALQTVGKLLIYGTFCALMANQTVLNMFELYVKPSANSPVAEKSPSADEQSYEWATQWSLPANETWSLIACDFHGASSRSETNPYWGRMGRSAGWEDHHQGYRNFRLAGYALGTVPFILLLYGWVFSRREPQEKRIPFYILNGMALLCLALSWGKYFFLYRLFFKLPLMGSIRNPEKWMCGFYVFIILAIAASFDFLLHRAQPSEPTQKKSGSKGLWVAAGLLPTLLFFNLIYLLKRTPFIQHLHSEGFGADVDPVYANSLHTLLLALFCAIIAGAAISLLLIQKKKKLIPIVSGILILLSIIELSQAAKPYVMPYQYRHLLEKNELIDLLKKEAPNNRIKVIPPQDPLLNNFRLSWLRAQNFSLFDPVSVRNMPADYTLLLDQLQTRPDTLWKMGAVRYFICTPQIAAQLYRQFPSGFSQKTLFTFTQSASGIIRPKVITTPPANNFYFVLLEYRDAFPHVRISRAVEPMPPGAAGQAAALNALKENSSDEWIDYIDGPNVAPIRLTENITGKVHVLSKTPAELRLKTESTAESFLIIAEKFDPQWIAEIDGKQTPVYRADGILQSVRLPAGTHEVVLRYQPPKIALTVSIASWGIQMALLLLFGASTLKRNSSER